MIDIFLKEDLQNLLQQKYVVFMGDSNIRALYKDCLCLLLKSQLIPERILKNKMEDSCLGDKLVYHGQRTNGRDYREERVAKIGSTRLSFFFLTRVYDNYVKDVLKEIKRKGCPDVLIINCCLWDVTRWGPTGVQEYKKRLKILMLELRKCIPDCLVIWLTTPPIACELRGGFLLKELQFLKFSLRFHVVEANHYARKIVAENGFDVLDSHYHLKMQIHRREKDGIHWDPETVRYITNLLLTHISLAWNKPLPHRYKSEIMQQNLDDVMEDEISEETKDTVQNKTSEETNKSSTAQETCVKTDKENTPKRKWKKITFTPSPVAASKKNRNTHHAFLRKAEKNKRRKRIRQWQTSGTTIYSPSFESPLPSTVSQHSVYCSPPPRRRQQSEIDTYNQSFESPVHWRSVHYSSQPVMSPIHQYSAYDAQHDSGYISSPNQTSLLGSSPSLLGSPQGSNFACYSSRAPLITNPYRPRQYRFGNRHFNTSYEIPIEQWNYPPQPKIDFTSYDPSGIYYF